MNIGHGESNVIYYIDFFMRNFLNTILASRNLDVEIDRNIADYSDTTDDKLRPDFLFYVNSFLILRGEEIRFKKETRIAVGELITKLQSWNRAIFGKLKYIFGFVCAGGNFKLYALGPSSLIIELSNQLDLRLCDHRF